ncbi:twin-arginine translocation signal domain-containing protein [Halorussus pelagicus]|uniref:twin-arginine translocation signal domain-containing protein n=1 Tax=Halorussus pelagicus TaxID=2505977 RepID=UPI000FFC8A82|nr:twin-arginine translocation signal domain-containing protein [Halorussus pelagicus]
MSDASTRRSFLKKSAATTTVLAGGLLGTAGSASASTDFVVEGYNNTSEEGHYSFKVFGDFDSINGDTDGLYDYIPVEDGGIINVNNVPPTGDDEYWTIEGGNKVEILEETNMSMEVV